MSSRGCWYETRDCSSLRVPIATKSVAACQPLWCRYSWGCEAQPIHEIQSCTIQSTSETQNDCDGFGDFFITWLTGCNYYCLLRSIFLFCPPRLIDLPRRVCVIWARFALPTRFACSIHSNFFFADLLIDPTKLIGFFAEIDVSSIELSLSLSNNARLDSDVLMCCRISFRARGL